MRSPALRTVRTLIVTVALLAMLLVVSSVLVHRITVIALSKIDSGVSVARVIATPEAMLLLGVSFPSRGVRADSAWVLLKGFPLTLEATDVVMTAATVLPVTRPGAEPFQRGSGRAAPRVSILRGVLVTGDQESDLFARYDSGVIVFGLAGSWGRAWGERSDTDSISVVFRDCTGLPGIPGLPGVLEGNAFCGVARGHQSGRDASFSGAFTSFNGRPVDMSFRMEMVQGRPGFEISTDFRQVAPQVSDFLFGMTGGAVSGAVPEGAFTVATAGGDTLFFSFDVSFGSVRVFHPSLARDTVCISCSSTGRGFVLPRSGTFSVDTAAFLLGTAGFGYSVQGGWGERRFLRLSMYNDSLRGDAIAASVPGPLLGRLRGLRLSGAISFDIGLFLDWDYPDSSDVFIDIDASGLRVDHSPVGFGRLAASSGETVLMRDSWGNSRTVGLDSISRPGFVAVRSFPPWLEPLLCAAEDGTFRHHSGFSEFHLRNSIRTDMSQGRFVRGGSTLSMQLVKNLFLSREKTLARKLQEVFLTWRMEAHLSKDRILELYVNVVELGPDVFGFGEAAAYYFGTTAESLSVRETAFLVSILPGPRLYHRFAVAGALPGYWNDYLDILVSAAESRTGLDGSSARSGIYGNLVFDGTVSGI
ncbi:MAG: biosynthetic peptidoglycan transglycosylase [Candidatus Fermentibacteraceae bacterium]